MGAEIRGGAGVTAGSPTWGGSARTPAGAPAASSPGKAPSPKRDVLLEVNRTPVSRLTNRDTLAVIRRFHQAIRLKTV